MVIIECIIAKPICHYVSRKEWPKFDSHDYDEDVHSLSKRRKVIKE